MDPKKPVVTDQQIDALLDALGTEGSDELLTRMLDADSAPVAPAVTSAKEIRARVKALAARDPQLIVRIITYWMNEDRRKR